MEKHYDRLNKALERSEPIFWEHEGNRAVRRGPWKLVAAHKKKWQLFNIDADRSETDDRAQQEPEIFNELKAAYEAWAERCGIQPWPLKMKPGFVLPDYPYPKTAPELLKADEARER